MATITIIFAAITIAALATIIYLLLTLTRTLRQIEESSRKSTELLQEILDKPANEPEHAHPRFVT